MSDLREIHAEIVKSINDIDEKLDSLVDTATAGKRKISNDLVEQYEPVWSPVVAGLIEQIRGMDADQMTAVFYGLTRSLDSEFKEVAGKFVEELSENAPKATPLISEDEAEELSKVRSELYQKAKAVVDLAANFGDDELDMPKTRRGSRGKRGKRALSLVTWSIDGSPVAEDDDSVAGVAKLLGFDKAKDFTEALRSGGVPAVEANAIDTRNPADTFSVEINGKTVSASKVDESDDSDEDSTEEE